MKSKIERQKPEGFLDYISLAVATVGVGFMPLAPGTWGAAVGVIIYIGISVGIKSILNHYAFSSEIVWPLLGSPHLSVIAILFAVIYFLLLLLILIGVWGADRSIPLLGNTDPSETVIDEVMGQLVTFLFVPIGVGWWIILFGFLLFRLFDIWKPYPVDKFENLQGGLGVCADDLFAGVYAGICLSFIYAISLYIG